MSIFQAVCRPSSSAPAQRMVPPVTQAPARGMPRVQFAPLTLHKVAQPEHKAPELVTDSGISDFCLFKDHQISREHPWKVTQTEIQHSFNLPYPGIKESATKKAELKCQHWRSDQLFPLRISSLTRPKHHPCEPTRHTYNTECLTTSDQTFPLIHCKFTAHKHSRFHYSLPGTGFPWHKFLYAKLCFHQH